MPNNPRGYPDSIVLKVRDAVGDRSDPETFNTETQQKVARDIQDAWPIEEFQEFAKDKDYSRQTVPDVLEGYFGPTDDNITFGEIEEKYGSFDRYTNSRQKGLGILDLPDGLELTERELELYSKASRDAFEKGYDKGFARGLATHTDGPD